MKEPLRIAAVGVGRIGVFHALHVQERARQEGDCVLAATVDAHADLARQTAARLQAGQEQEIRAFSGVEELLRAGTVDAAVIASRTEDHHAHARALVGAGCRVLLEKPLTHSLETARAFCDWLGEDPTRSRGVMQAFMRRFDAALVHAKGLVDGGAVGTPFKITSVLEDPQPPPDGYQSPGLLADMSVHNIDEILWLGGRRPRRVGGSGSRLYNQRVSSVEEDFDDAFLHMRFDGHFAAQVQVSRNHVAGYRNETWVFGDEGVVQVGHFAGNPLEATVAAYGRDHRVIERRAFALRDYSTSVGAPVPVFITRFGPAYRAELDDFVACCREDRPFAVDQRDGLAALEVADAGSRALQRRADEEPVEYAP